MIYLISPTCGTFRQVDKLEFVQHISRVPSEEGRNAELALYRKSPEEAEAILLQTSPPLVYRAIKLNVSVDLHAMPNLHLVKYHSKVDGEL